MGQANKTGGIGLTEFNFSKPVINGWHWRTLAITVVAIAALQVILDLATSKYNIVMTTPIAVLFVGYLVIPRIKERRVGNAVVGVLAIFAIDLILQVTLDAHGKTPVTGAIFLEENAMSLLLGAFVVFGYTRMTAWSDRKREEREAKRRGEAAPAQNHPPRRHHSKKKRRK